ncbi:MAG TPA: hypothetical protein VMX96_07140 [Dehalococcoidia bacterium]|nr:hypothetical protein [Dehalococcoidia bacterium]
MLTFVFKDELEKVLNGLLTNIGRIWQLSTLAGSSDITFSTYLGRKEFLKHHPVDKIRGYAETYPDLQEYIDKYGPREGFWRYERSLPRKVNRLLYKQMVVLLITIFEAFIGDVLLITFRAEPRCLSSGKNISWEKIIELGDYNSIIEYIASERCAVVLSGDWYKIEAEFSRLFNIDLSGEIEEKAIAEIFEIRHAVVHRVGLVDQRFIDKVNSSEWGINYSSGKEIIISRREIRRMASFIEYAAFTIYNQIIAKFKGD